MKQPNFYGPMVCCAYKGPLYRPCDHRGVALKNMRTRTRLHVATGEERVYSPTNGRPRVEKVSTHSRCLARLLRSPLSVSVLAPWLSMLYTLLRMYSL